MNDEKYTTENVRVFLRIRPFNVLEESSGLENILKANSANAVTIRKPNQKICEKTFTFSKVFNSDSQQLDVYRNVAVPIVEKVFQGFNGTIFAYGQSGTGKTHTMMGDTVNDNLKGVIPNIFSHIFSEISVSNKDTTYLVTVTYLEIYNEEVRDLLSENRNKKLAIRERADVGVYVKDLLGFTVDSIKSVTDLLVRGNKIRATGSTKLNDLSSRSHAIFTVCLESKNKTTNKTKFGKLNLVDLAGSERVVKSKASGDRLKEAGKINLSLSVLGNVISALVDKRTSHIPYRNSKLTRLLQDSLGGNSLTAMIAMVSPSELDYEESLFTLMYADRVKNIQNHLSVNLEKNSIIKQFETKIIELEKQLEQLNQDEQVKMKQQKNKMSTSKTKLHDEQLLQIEYEKQQLLGKLNTVQKKILVGGENLIEKAQIQLYLLENTSKELESLHSTQQAMENALILKEMERNITEKKFSSLQEEDKELERQIEEVEKQLDKYSNILLNKEAEYQNEISELLMHNKMYDKHLKFVEMCQENYIPKKYLGKVMSNMHWNEDSSEWRLKYIAHTGNNIRKKHRKSKFARNIPLKIDEEIFHDYTNK